MTPYSRQVSELIKEAFEELGETLTIRETFGWINRHYPTEHVKESSVSTAMSDLAINGPPSSQYPDDQKFLYRVGRGLYQLQAKSDRPPKTSFTASPTEVISKETQQPIEQRHMNLPDSIGGNMGGEFFTAGEPYPFATRGEKTWKELLMAQIPENKEDRKSVGVTLKFFYTPVKHKGYFDVDNVCEPVFSILVNKKGWFGSSRPNICWFISSKTDAGDPGVRIHLHNSNPPAFNFGSSEVLFDKIYSGPLPRNASDAIFVEWIKKNSKELNKSFAVRHYSILIQFGSQSENLGDIACGRIKNIVDCLNHITGDDRSITYLQVEKGTEGIQPGNARIVITST